MTVPLSARQNESAAERERGTGTGKVELDGDVLELDRSPIPGLTGPVTAAPLPRPAAGRRERRRRRAVRRQLAQPDHRLGKQLTRGAGRTS